MHADATDRRISTHDCFMAFSEHFEDVRSTLISNMNQSIKEFPSISNPIDDSAYELNLHWIRTEMRKALIEKITKHPLLSIRKIDIYNQEQKMTPYEKAVSESYSLKESEIQQARDFPIRELYKILTGENPVNGLFRCHFHDDKTASLSLNKYNCFKCFGCDAKGDVINLYRKFNPNVSFISSVRNINKL